LRQLLEPRAFLIARDVVLRAWILVIAARSPVARTPFARPAPAILQRFFARRKDFPALEPDDLRVRLFALELFERRKKIFPVAPAKCRRLSAGNDGPVRCARHI